MGRGWAGSSPTDSPYATCLNKMFFILLYIRVKRFQGFHKGIIIRPRQCKMNQINLQYLYAVDRPCMSLYDRVNAGWGSLNCTLSHIVVGSDGKLIASWCASDQLIEYLKSRCIYLQFVVIVGVELDLNLIACS